MYFWNYILLLIIDQFVCPIVGPPPASLPTTQKLKLLQLESYASLELPSYQGPFLPSELKVFPPEYKVFTTTLHRSVIKVLQASLGEDFSVAESVPSDMGCVIGEYWATAPPPSVCIQLVYIYIPWLHNHYKWDFIVKRIKFVFLQ